MPKTLLPLGQETILATILKTLSQVGIDEFIIVVGYQCEHIINYLQDKLNFGLDIRIVKNPQWERGNGISVLAAEPAVGQEQFLLSMSDHIVSPSAIARIINHSSAANLLLVDPKINQVFDLDDATKVNVVQNKIIAIGKTIPVYNGIDCGIFKLTPRYFDSMREQLKLNQESNSAAIQGLIHNQDMEAVLMEEHDFWIDIDTPESYHHALQQFQ